MIAKIQKSELSGTIAICPSKSYEQRLWAISSLMQQNIEVSNIGNSDDANASRKIAENLKKNANNVFDCGESALCARMFPPIIALRYPNFTIECKGSLRQRKIDHDLRFYAETFGWEISSNGFSIHVGNAKIKAGEYTIDGKKTSQIATGLILALSATQGNSSLTIENPVSSGYILMTIDIANQAGAKMNARMEGSSMIIDINGDTPYRKTNFTIEGDWSNAAFIIAAGLINGNIGISGLNSNSLQPDRAIIKAMDLCHARYEWKNDTLVVRKSDIKSFNFDATDCPDLIPPLCILALNADNECSIKGADRLIGKESNRLEAIANELGKLGCETETGSNRIIVKPHKGILPATVDSHNDHRIAMMLSVIGLSSGKISLKGYECIAKSYPEFFNDLKKLGSAIELES